jgi:hypothetical protein
VLQHLIRANSTLRASVEETSRGDDNPSYRKSRRRGKRMNKRGRRGSQGGTDVEDYFGDSGG